MPLLFLFVFAVKQKIGYDKIIYAEVCLNKIDAERREGYLKTTQGRRFLKLRIKEFLK